MGQKPSRNWVVAHEVADILGVSLGTVSRMKNDGLLPSSELVYGTWLYWLNDVLRLKAKREVNPPKAGRRPIQKPKNQPRKRVR